MTTENPKDNEKNKENIKYGILHQKSVNINLSKFFNIYFDKTKPNIINNAPNLYEFTPTNLENIVLTFDVIIDEEIQNLNNIYNFFNFFAIFIDIQTRESLEILETFINRLINCSDDITKKTYIFGVYKDEENIINKDEQITNILNSKGVDYEYSEININIKEDFEKGLNYLIEDSKEIKEELDFEENYRKNGRDKGKSCQIM